MIKVNKPSFSIFIFCIALLTALAGCHQQDDFNTEKWDTTEGVHFPLRNYIVNDLIQHHQLKGLKYRQITRLLRYPQYKDSVSFYYEIIDTYNNMHQHEHVKNLVFHMGKDSVITGVEIYDKQYKYKK
jgi:hypothetical protein